MSQKTVAIAKESFDKLGRLVLNVYDTAADETILIVVDEDQKAC